MSDSPLLCAEAITAGYGEGIVLYDVGFTLTSGRSLAVLGRNGVGKSTLMLALLGHVPLRSGKIEIRGVDVTAAQPHDRVNAGLGWVPQGRECFPSLTVDEHLVIAARKVPAFSAGKGLRDAVAGTKKKSVAAKKSPAKKTAAKKKR